jgi:benzoyl-CoA reductase/2-hydroxyglutaryl-CoA dehydratase subunit BcrC/BadD/HgdB
VVLPGGFEAPRSQVDFTFSQLEIVRAAMEQLTGESLDDQRLSEGIGEANQIRACLEDLRRIVFTADICPMPALEMQIAEMLAIHFCSDREESIRVLSGLLDEARRRAQAGEGLFGPDAVRVFWVNPVADLRIMNLLEECGGRVCGTEYLFSHALDRIPTDIPPMRALACMALADPMVGSCDDRADRICRDIKEFGSEAVVLSRIPGASHCALEGGVISDMVRSETGLPVVEIEVPPVCDPMMPTLRTRLQALVESVREKR